MQAALVCYYRRDTRNSINALLAALDCEGLSARVDVYLERTAEAFERRVSGAAGRYDAVVAAVSFSSPQLFAVSEMPLLSRPAAGRVLRVAGGPHPTAMPRHALRMGFDLVVVGEGERTFADWLAHLVAAGPAAVARGILHGRPGALSYPSVATAYHACGPVEISRGCPYRCAYCQTPRLFGRDVRHRSVDSVARQVRDMAALGLVDFRFVAPNAFGYGAAPGRVSPHALEQLLSEAARAAGRGRVFLGSFPSEVRPDCVTGETLEVLRRYASNRGITVGMQAGSDRLLTACRRGHTVRQALDAVGLAIEFGYEVAVDVIFGLPDETPEDVTETVEVLRYLVARGARIHAHTYIPLPGTEYWPRPAAAGSKALDDALRSLVPAGGVFGQWEAHRSLGTRLLEALSEYAHDEPAQTNP